MIPKIKDFVADIQSVLTAELRGWDWVDWCYFFFLLFLAEFCGIGIAFVVAGLI